MHGSMGGGRKPASVGNAARHQAPPAYPTALRQTVWSAGASLRKLARVAVAVGAAVEPQLRGGAGCLKVAGSGLMCTLGRWSRA
jgi:hypothetical protein